MLPPPPSSTLFPYTTLFRSCRRVDRHVLASAAYNSCCPSRRKELLRRIDHAMILVMIAGTCTPFARSEEHTSELQSPVHLVCRLLLEKKKKVVMSIQNHRLP